MNIKLGKGIHFIQNEVEKVAMKIEKKNKIPTRIVKMSKEMGLFRFSIPEQYGDLGISMVGICSLYEEIGVTHNGYTTLIGAFALTEPDAGSHASNL